ncbi:MAG: hypothetical protein CM15mP130_2470 [Verrucomicrobiota bacterium]|nr:MAG: hypothetical protein CM15mP130_2470 [Verrucomicrobiota bacterium]
MAKSHSLERHYRRSWWEARVWTSYPHPVLSPFHAGVLPATLVALVVAHIYLFRKHGIHVKEPRPKRDSYFWPDQVLKMRLPAGGSLGSGRSYYLFSRSSAWPTRRSIQ